MYYKQRRNWGVIALVFILGISNLSLMNTLVSQKFKSPFPNLNLPVGPYTSYRVVTSEKGYSNNTLMAYSNDLKLFANFMEEKDKFEWADVSTKDINIYFNSIRKSLSESSYKRKYASIKSFFDFLYEHTGL